MASHQPTPCPLLTNSRHWLLLCALVACSLPPAEGRTCQSPEQNLLGLPQVRVTYSDNPDPDSGGLTALYSMVHTFLSMVQPNPFPTDLIQSLIHDISVIQNNYVKILEYQVGYLVCAAIGILFFLLMPIVGISFCCCRCCGLCGGRMYQKQTKSVNCKRRGLAISLTLLTTFMLAGNVCVYISNEKVTDAVTDSATLMNNTLDNLSRFLNTIPTQITDIVNSSSIPINAVNTSLDNIGQTLGGEVLDSLGGELYPALNSASQLAQDVNKITQELVLVSLTSGRLQDQEAIVTNNLTAIQQDLNQTLLTCSTPHCDNATALLTYLTVTSNFSKLTFLGPIIYQMLEVVKLDLNATVQKGYDALNDTPALITNQSTIAVSDVRKQLESIEEQIGRLASEIPVLDAVHTIDSELNNIAQYLNKYLPQIELVNLYRWTVGIALSSVILLVLLFNYLGLLLGILGLKRNVLSTKRSCSANCGGQLLMAGVGFSFLFSWLLMILIFILFFVGGNVYSLICQPWGNQQLFQFLDTPGVIPNFNLAQTLGLENVTLNISDIYNDCQNNTPLWAALHLDQVFDLDQYLDLSQYKEDINKTFDKMTVDLSGITLLNSAGEDALTNLSNTGLRSLNFSSIVEELQRPVTQGDLQEIASHLRTLAVTVGDPVEAELMALSERLDELNDWINNNMRPNIVKMDLSIQYLQTVTPHTESNANITLEMIKSAQTVLLTEAPRIIKESTSVFLECQLDQFERFVQWTRTAITQEMAQCLPAAQAIDATETIACAYIVDSLNAFWFSLGWCTILFIPSIILAVKLAKYYRKMDKADQYEYEGSHMELMAPTLTPELHFPRANIHN